MDAPGRSSRCGGLGGDKPHRAGVLSAPSVSGIFLAVLLAAAVPLTSAAQTAPAAKPKPAPVKPAPIMPTPAPPASSSNGVQPDLPFGAFQRGYYLTAFSLATQRANDQ